MQRSSWCHEVLHDEAGQRRWLRGLIRAVQMITGIAFVYAVLLNTVVATPLLRTLVANHLGRALDIQYAHAYSLVPGRVHVTELSLRGADSHVEWLVKIDRASFDVHPFALLHRQFRASRVSARGVGVRVRLLEGMPAPEHDSHVPPIPGFSDPPLKLAGPPVTSVDGKYDLFTIELDGVTARNVYEVWVDTLRFAGDFDVRGRWEFRPLRRLAIGPASVDVARLDVARGSDAAFVTAIHGHLGVTIDPYDVRLPTPRETLRYLSLRADVTAVVRASELFRMVRVPESLATPNGDELATTNGVDAEYDWRSKEHLAYIGTVRYGKGNPFDQSLITGAAGASYLLHFSRYEPFAHAMGGYTRLASQHAAGGMYRSNVNSGFLMLFGAGLDVKLNDRWGLRALTLEDLYLPFGSARSTYWSVGSGVLYNLRRPR